MHGIPVSEKHCGIKSDGICAVGLLNTMVYRLAVLIFNRLSSSHNLFHFRKSYFQWRVYWNFDHWSLFSV